jgi:hypothetical protein
LSTEWSPQWSVLRAIPSRARWRAHRRAARDAKSEGRILNAESKTVRIQHECRELTHELGKGLGDELTHELGEGLGDELTHELGEALTQALGDALGEALTHALGDALTQGLGEALGDALTHALGEALGDALTHALGDALGDAVPLKPTRLLSHCPANNLMEKA